MAKCDTTIGICADGTKARSELSKTKQSTEKFSSGVGKSLKKIALMAGAAGGAYIAMKKLGDFMKSSLQAYKNQEIAETKLNAALEATGRYSETAEEMLHNFAAEMQEATGIGDDLIIAASGIMTTFTKIGTETFPEALEAAANMSKMFGQDLQQSVIQLGTALNDPILGIGRLKRIGISFTEDQRESVKQFMAQNDIMSAQRIILDELNLEIGGVARALGETYAGQVDILKGSMGDLKEEIGELMANQLKPMLPVIIDLTTATKNFVAQINANKEAWLLYQKALATGEEERTREEIEALVSQVQKQIEINNNLLKVHMATLESTEGVGRAAGMARMRIAALVTANTDLEAKLSTLETQLVKIVEIEVERKKVVKETVKPTEDLTAAIEEYWNTLEEGEWDWIIEMYESQAVAVDELAIAQTNLHGTYSIGVMEAENAATASQLLIADQIKAFQDLATAATMSFDIIDSASSMSFQNRTTELNDWYQTKKTELEAEYTDEEELAIAMAELDKEMAEKSAKIRTDQAKAERRMAIFGIVVNTALAVSKVWGQTGIFGVAAQILPILMGIAQLAIVASQKIPEFQYGGIVGEGYGGGDKKIIAAEEGEMVIRKEVVRTNRSALEAMNVGEQGMMAINVYLGTKKIYSEITKAVRDKQIPLYRGALVER